MKRHLLLIFTILCLSPFVTGQSSAARGDIISGNKSYESGNYEKAEAQYKSALSKDNNSVKADYNLGNSLYQQKKYDEARAHYDRVIRNSEANNSDKHKAYHNIGKTYLDERNAERAVENLKEALKLNPEDDETRYNYALAKKMLEEQQDQDDAENKDEESEDDNRDSDDNEDGNNSEQQDNQDQTDENQEDAGNQDRENEQNDQSSKNQDSNNEQDQDNDGNSEQDNQREGVNNQGNREDSGGKDMDRQRQERILDALKQQEEGTLQKIISQKAKKSRNDSTKDW